MGKEGAGKEKLQIVVVVVAIGTDVVTRTSGWGRYRNVRKEGEKEGARVIYRKVCGWV